MAALTEAVFAIDARTGLVNLGTGGAALNPTSGSNPSAADSNDPTYLAHTGTNYLYLPGADSNNASISDATASALDITGNLDVRMRFAYDSWSTGGNAYPLSKNNTAWYWTIPVSGIIQLIIVDSTGETRVFSSSVALPFTGNQEGWVRTHCVGDNGAGQAECKFYTSTDGTNWTQLGSTRTGTFGTIAFAVNNDPLVIGGLTTGSGSARSAGKYYQLQIFNGSTLALDADFTTGITSGAQTSFTATTGQTVTINRSTTGKKACAVTRPVWLFGTDDYLEVADNALLDFGASDSFTVLAAARVWGHNAVVGPYVAKRASAYGNEAGYSLHRNTGTVDFVFADGTNRPIGAANLPTVGTLTVVTGVRNVAADNKITYVNATGASPVTDTTTGSLANALALRVGADGAPNYADMELFAVAIWRRALSASEVSAMSTALTNAVLAPTSPDARALTLNTTPKGLVLS